MNKYIDIYNVIWTKIDDYTIHNPIKGYGVWDNGHGLTKV